MISHLYKPRPFVVDDSGRRVNITMVEGVIVTDWDPQETII